MGVVMGVGVGWTTLGAPAHASLSPGPPSAPAVGARWQPRAAQRVNLNPAAPAGGPPHPAGGGGARRGRATADATASHRGARGSAHGCKTSTLGGGCRHSGHVTPRKTHAKTPHTRRWVRAQG
ncbi:MAG: hypothetical protein J3K34DRAFT_424781 [Monoraphidium minutum]|nr:MAG: hypothetical protein J3K34DRAFT_424781 [Monoraphidium minutum]